MLIINIKKDYYAYLSVDINDNGKLFNLIKKSFTRTEKVYNNLYRMYETRTKIFYSVVEQGKYIKIKAGVVPYLTASLDKVGIKYIVKDERNTYNQSVVINAKLNDETELRDYQYEAASIGVKERFGCIQLPTGTGKTEVSAAMIKAFLNVHFKEALVYVVPTCRLQTESVERFNKYNIKTNTEFPIKVGCVNVITYLAMVRADNNKFDYRQRNSVGAIIFDECHKLSADKASKITHRLPNLRMSIGMSATTSSDTDNKTYLKELNSKELLVYGCTGPILYKMDIQESIDDKFVVPIEVRVVEYNSEHKLSEDENDWHLIKRVLLKDENRAKFVADYTQHIVNDANLNTVVLLTPEVGWSQLYMKYVAENFKEDKDIHIFELYGNNRIIYHKKNGKTMEVKTQEQKDNIWKMLKDPSIRTVFSATTFLYEGIDIPCIQALINCGSGRDSKRVRQQLGRCMRLFKDKSIAYIHEIKDKGNVVLESQFRHRIDIYKEEYDARIIYSSFGKEK
nr:MAG TPA: Chromatin remodeling complex ATPase [Caudoviricetes sp.]